MSADVHFCKAGTGEALSLWPGAKNVPRNGEAVNLITPDGVHAYLVIEVIWMSDTVVSLGCQKLGDV